MICIHHAVSMHHAQDAMSEMQHQSRRDRAKAQRMQQVMRWACMPHLSKRQTETGQRLRAKAAGSKGGAADRL